MDIETNGQNLTDPTTPDIKAAGSVLTSETKDAVRAVAHTAKQEASRVGSVVKDVVKEQGEQLKTQVGSTLYEQAEGVKSGLAQSLDQAAVKVRTKASEMERTALGMKIAQPLERGAEYLHQTPIEQMPSDLKGTVRQYPLQAVVVAFAAGWLFGMVLKRVS